MQLCGQPRTGNLPVAQHAPHRHSAHAYRHMRRVHTHHHTGVPSGDADAYLRNLAAHTAGRTHRSQFNKERRPLSADYACRKRPGKKKLRPYLAAKMDSGRKGRPPAEKKVKMGRTLFDNLHVKMGRTLFDNLHVKMGRTLFDNLHVKMGRTLFDNLHVKMGRTLFDNLHVKMGRTLFDVEVDSTPLPDIGIGADPLKSTNSAHLGRNWILR